jgi:uncharacterized protein (TIGR02444 family)
MMKAAAQAATPLVPYSTKSREFHRAATMRHPGGEDDVAGEAFWRFSLALYARPGVADALIEIQDRAARDVNVILFGLWLGASQSRRLAAGELAHAAAAIAPIVGAIVAPLRQQRRQLKGHADPDLAALRRRIAGLEIAAERVQYRLAARLPGLPGAEPEGDRLAAAQANLALYLGGEARSREAGVVSQALASLIRRAKPSEH